MTYLNLVNTLSDSVKQILLSLSSSNIELSRVLMSLSCYYILLVNLLMYRSIGLTRTWYRYRKLLEFFHIHPIISSFVHVKLKLLFWIPSSVFLHLCIIQMLFIWIIFTIIPSTFHFIVNSLLGKLKSHQ